MAELTWRQEKAVAALMKNATVRRAAAEAGVGARSIERWMAEDDDFRDALQAAQRRALEHATANLGQVSGGAVSTLASLLSDSNPAIRLRAARSVLEFAMRGADRYDVEERLRLLEEGEDDERL